ncbi:MAG: tetratricopeptide repeat protein [Phycisphaerae bacterium]|nr:tetratricopeptide repeat protein [Phycisphaerae bacterium]
MIHPGWPGDKHVSTRGLQAGRAFVELFADDNCLGCALDDKGDFAEAIATCEKAIELDPKLIEGLKQASGREE